MNKTVAHVLKGNVPIIPYIKIENPNGSVVFYGKENLIWENKELLERDCFVLSGYDCLICRLKEKYEWEKANKGVWG